MELKDDETGSSRKRQKFHDDDGEGKHVCTEEVGIGKLPDEMLCHILSFLGTKDAVQNSVLSKRWRYFWTSVPCIDIRYPNDRCCIYFIHKFLRLNTLSCLRKFSLSWSLGYEVLSELISVVMLNRDIEEIVLTQTQFGGDRYIQLPPSIFTCEKLVILNLGSGIFLDVPSLVHLPSLKILHIYVGQFFYKDSITKILDGCPVIAELNIKLVEAVNTLFVQSSLVKILNINLNWFGRPGDLRAVVDVPNVERLDLTSRGNVQYDISSLSSLVKLNTSISQDSGVVELLRKFTNTKYMEFSHKTLTSLECQPLDDFPIFYNLTHLVVDFHEYSRTVLPVLLECSPNLVTLVFYSAGKGRSHEEQLHHFKAPKCMMLYLEEIELRGLKGFMHETEMISYFLKNAVVLKKLSIQSVYSSAKKHSEISKKLLTFPRISPECQIIFD